MKRKLNRDQKTRDKVIWGDVEPSYTGGICNFKVLTSDQLERLIEENFINLFERQNNSPSVEQFREFLKKHPDMVAHGYAVGLEREDYRVTIEGVCFAGKQAASQQLMEDFEELCLGDKFGSGPDSMNIESLYCWWD